MIKDPRQRLRDIGEARLAIEEVLTGETGEEPAVTAPAVPARPFGWAQALPWAAAALLAVMLAWTWQGRLTAPPPAGEARNQRLSVALGPDELLSLTNHDYEIMTPIAVSPTGDSVVYVADASGETMASSGGSRVLRRRSLDRYVTEVIRGTEDAEMPFFSPDGRWIGFYDGDQLVKVPAAGGARVTITETAGPGNGASWGRDDTIVFAHSYAGPLWTVPASGGDARPLTKLAADELSHRYPQLLPDGKSVLFTIKVSGILSFDDARIAIADLETGEHRTVVEKGMYGMYVSSGHLVFARQGSLLAAPFDLERQALTGGAVPVLDGVIANPITGSALFATAPDGTLVYVPAHRGSGLTTLIRVERKTGKRTVLDTEHSMSFPHLSPDETRLVLHGAAANDQVMVVDLERGTVLRVSDASHNNILPTWGPHGDRVVFTTLRSGAEEIVWMPAGGGPMETLVEPFGGPQDCHTWSSDGRLLAFHRGVRDSRDIWILDVEKGGGPYPGPGGKIQFSSGGGFFPRWRGDGGELYYQDETGLYAVPVRWTPQPRPGRPERLFAIDARNPMSYDVTRDGEIFYIVEIDERFWIADRFNIVLNWLDELERLTSDGS
jgi:serine/threonine-protein kinase